MIKRICLTLALCSFAHASYAADKPDKWNNEVSKEVRSKLANNPTTTYKTLETKDAYIPPNNSTDVAVRSKYTDAYIKNGSKAGVVIEGVETRLTKAEVAAQLAKRYGHYVQKGLAIGAGLPLAIDAVRALLEGVDYVMGDGGKIIRKNSDIDKKPCNNVNKCEWADDLYRSSQWSDGNFYSSASVTCDAILAYIQSNRPDVGYASASMNGSSCALYTPIYNSTTNVPVYSSKNLNYLAGSKKPEDSLNNSDVEKAIKDALENPNADQEKVKSAAKSAANYVDKNGEKTNNANEADTASGVNDVAKKVEQSARDQIKDDANPTGSKSVTSGTNGKNDSDTKTQTEIKDKDGNTTGTTTGTDTSSGNFDLPPFCDWAASMCSWYEDWKKDSEEMRKKPEIDTPQLPEKTLEKKNFDGTLFGNSAAACPADSVLNMPFLGIKTFTYSFSYARVCDNAQWLSWVFVGFAYFMGAMIVVRNS